VGVSGTWSVLIYTGLEGGFQMVVWTSGAKALPVWRLLTQA
jgi:hypothetical protein